MENSILKKGNGLCKGPVMWHGKEREKTISSELRREVGNLWILYKKANVTSFQRAKVKFIYKESSGLNFSPAKLKPKPSLAKSPINKMLKTWLFLERINPHKFIQHQKWQWRSFKSYCKNFTMNFKHSMFYFIERVWKIR